MWVLSPAISKIEICRMIDFQIMIKLFPFIENKMCSKNFSD